MYYLVGGGGGTPGVPAGFFPTLSVVYLQNTKIRFFFKRKIDKYHIYSSSMIYENAIVRSKHKHFSASFAKF